MFNPPNAPPAGVTIRRQTDRLEIKDAATAVTVPDKNPLRRDVLSEAIYPIYQPGP